MKEVFGEAVPDINAHLFTRVVLGALAHKPTPLTGAELRFIRTHFEETQAKFARACHVTAAAVCKWETSGQEATGMTWATEFFIRHRVLAALPESMTIERFSPAPSQSRLQALMRETAVWRAARPEPVGISRAELERAMAA